MDPQVKRAWIRALRSGEYEQYHQGALSSRRDHHPEEPDQFCCLGVLCDIYIQQNDIDEAELRLWESRGMLYSETELLPTFVYEWAGLSTGSPSVYLDDDGEPITVTSEDAYDSYNEHDIADLNDSGYTFRFLADCIEKSL